MSTDSKTLNDGFYFQNPKSERPEAQTIVVCGPARGGTTMIAKILLNLGVYLGEDLTRHTHEDMEIFKALEKDQWEAFEHVVSKRNSQFSVWGWKRPQTVDRLPDVAPRLRNPFFIILFRDPASVAKRNMITAGGNFFNSLVSASEAMIKGGQFARHSGFPCLLISYEKAIKNPERLVEKIVQFLHLRPSENMLCEAIKSVLPENPSYRNMFVSQQILGRVDGLEDHYIFGWAVLKGDLKPIELELWVNGSLVETFLADIFRPDLKEHGIGEGNHAFKISFGSYLIPDETNLLDVRIAGSRDSLLGSPTLYSNPSNSVSD